MVERESEDTGPRLGAETKAVVRHSQPRCRRDLTYDREVAGVKHDQSDGLVRLGKDAQAGASGDPVGGGFASPDNLSVDHDGNIYIVEDRSGGVDDDIWFAKDSNKDGDLTDAGDGMGRWASNGTVGSEFTGLYFDPTNKRRAWVNIQHPASGNDRTIEITVP
jgi:secreted PhoX family phosphatase